MRHVHHLISGAYTAAVREGLITVSPAVRAKPPTLREAKEHRDDYVVGSGQELAHLLEVARDDHYFPLWRVLAATGMRRGEALGLHWSDVDLDSLAKETTMSTHIARQ